jgi:hypothetical protein
MNVSPQFLRFASVCCFITVITTLGIHLYFTDPPASFEQRILLFRNKTYLINRWWVIAHCLLVIVSMWGFALIQIKKAPGFIGIGFVFFVVFSIAEITRQMYVLFYLNELKEQYSLVTDPVLKGGLKQTITTAGLLAAPLFGIFIFTFGLGNLCYGISLFNEKGFDKILSVLLMLWAAGNFLALGNSFWQLSTLNAFIEKYSFTYQPLMRALLALWIWKKSGASKQTSSTRSS